MRDRYVSAYRTKIIIVVKKHTIGVAGGGDEGINKTFEIAQSYLRVI